MRRILVCLVLLCAVLGALAGSVILEDLSAAVPSVLNGLSSGSTSHVFNVGDLNAPVASIDVSSVNGDVTITCDDSWGGAANTDRHCFYSSTLERAFLRVPSSLCAGVNTDLTLDVSNGTAITTSVVVPCTDYSDTTVNDPWPHRASNQDDLVTRVANVGIPLLANVTVNGVRMVFDLGSTYYGDGDANVMLIVENSLFMNVSVAIEITWESQWRNASTGSLVPFIRNCAFSDIGIAIVAHPNVVPAASLNAVGLMVHTNEFTNVAVAVMAEHMTQAGVHFVDSVDIWNNEFNNASVILNGVQTGTVVYNRDIGILNVVGTYIVITDNNIVRINIGTCNSDIRLGGVYTVFCDSVMQTDNLLVHHNAFPVTTTVKTVQVAHSGKNIALEANTQLTFANVNAPVDDTCTLQFLPVAIDEHGDNLALVCSGVDEVIVDCECQVCPTGTVWAGTRCVATSYFEPLTQEIVNTLQDQVTREIMLNNTLISLASEVAAIVQNNVTQELLQEENIATLFSGLAAVVQNNVTQELLQEDNIAALFSGLADIVQNNVTQEILQDSRLDSLFASMQTEITSRLAGDAFLNGTLDSLIGEVASIVQGNVTQEVMQDEFIQSLMTALANVIQNNVTQEMLQDSTIELLVAEVAAIVQNNVTQEILQDSRLDSLFAAMQSEITERLAGDLFLNGTLDDLVIAMAGIIQNNVTQEVLQDASIAAIISSVESEVSSRIQMDVYHSNMIQTIIANVTQLVHVDMMTDDTIAAISATVAEIITESGTLEATQQTRITTLEAQVAAMQEAMTALTTLHADTRTTTLTLQSSHEDFMTVSSSKFVEHETTQKQSTVATIFISVVVTGLVALFAFHRMGKAKHDGV